MRNDVALHVPVSVRNLLKLIYFENIPSESLRRH